MTLLACYHPVGSSYYVIAVSEALSFATAHTTDEIGGWYGDNIVVPE